MKRLKYLLIVFGISYLMLAVSNASENKEMTGIFPEIPGIPKVGEPLIYSPENLFEYINGAAEVYLNYGFQELLVQEYENLPQQFLMIEVYRHNHSTNGFGIYSQERFADSNFLDIGAQGYYEKGICNFVLGKYYVKISGFDLGENEQSLLTTVANQLAKQLDGDPQLPAVLTYFPEQGKIQHSEQFIPQDFLGYPFLKTAFTADYKISETSFQLFIMRGNDRQDCKDMLKQYMTSTNTSEQAIEERQYSIEDPYHGTIDLIWKDTYIWGVKGLDDPEKRTEYLMLLEKQLRTQR